ncbi:fermentation/respiration switch protein [Poriferisphaera corsica]|uniref:Fermentation/respiration switch protein n=1 Tax=Poriferisphaera corsica TaxID=2528020 RepID=A0A517YSM1_9BACT|nr:fermentation/respiration switch protein [Poriferisphaera corsica]
MKQVYFELDHGGQLIRGMRYLPEGGSGGNSEGDGPFPTVMLCHGFTGNRYEAGLMFVNMARMLASEGIAAVTFDFLNSGESDGSFEFATVSGELADAACVLRDLREQPFVDRDRMGVVGFSLGGLVSACLMEKVDFVKSLVLIAPTTVKNMMRRQLAEGEVKEIGPFRMNPEFYDDIQMLDSLKACVMHPRPTALIFGEADEAVPLASNSAKYLEVMTEAGLDVSHTVMDGASHCFESVEHREQLHGLVLEHLKKTL